MSPTFNGTKFVGGNRILQENLEFINENELNKSVCDGLKQLKTTWHFSPAGAPHFNGLAEAAVKSVKLHLKKTIGDTILSFEEFLTLLIQVEACVNSRPLCALSSSPNDMAALTPAHFLIGQPIVCPPEENHLETKLNWLNRWQRVQQMTQSFWKRWQCEYLNQLQTRTKWEHEKHSPKVNDLVLIKEENVPIANWITGRIVELHPGDDKLTRVVSVKTEKTTKRHPITKLCPFPKDEYGQSISTNMAKATTKMWKSFKARGWTQCSIGHNGSSNNFQFRHSLYAKHQPTMQNRKL